MTDYALTKISSKGQIVIPTELRNDIEIGEKLLVIKGDKQFIIKRVKDLDKHFQDDLEFAKRTDKALKRYEKGLFKEKSGDEFLEELERW